MLARYEYYKDVSKKKKPWSFVLKDPSEQPLLFSKGYSRRQTARQAVGTVRECAKDKSRFVLRPPRKGIYRFVVKTYNNQVICTSGDYFSLQEAGKGLERAMKWASEAKDDGPKYIRIFVPETKVRIIDKYTDLSSVL